MTDSLSVLFNALALVIVLMLLIGFAFPSGRKGRALSPSAVIGLAVFLALFAFAVYLIFE